jgi:hypothetical protein
MLRSVVNRMFLSVLGVFLLFVSSKFYWLLDSFCMYLVELVSHLHYDVLSSPKVLSAICRKIPSPWFLCSWREKKSLVHVLICNSWLVVETWFSLGDRCGSQDTPTSYPSSGNMEVQLPGVLLLSHTTPNLQWGLPRGGICLCPISSSRL